MCYASSRKHLPQVLGPNLDPRFPDCLVDDPDRARSLLRQCYDNALSSFWELASSAAAAAAAAASSSEGASAAGGGSVDGGGEGAGAMAVGREGGKKRKR